MSDGNEKLYDFVARSNACALVCEDPSLTVQSDSVDADINVIVARFGITGKMPENVRLPQFGDFEGVSSYLDAMLVMEDADRQFMSLPADIRAKFDNDPAVFHDIATNPENIGFLREIGLAKAVDSVITPSTADVPPKEKGDVVS